MKHPIVAFLLLLLPLFAEAAQSQIVETEHVRAQLVSEQDSIAAGETFWVALRFDHDEHWHTYWKNPGDAGLTTSLEWTLPEGFTAGDIHWPAPSLYMQEAGSLKIANYVYEGETFLLVPITAPDSLPAEDRTIAVRADWLECAEICIPGSAELSLTLSTGESVINPKWHSAFEKTRNQDWAKTSDAITQTFSKNPAAGLVTLMLNGSLNEDYGELFFFDENAVLNPSADQIISHDGETLSIQLRLAEGIDPETVTELQGVLVADKPIIDGISALQVDTGTGNAVADTVDAISLSIGLLLTAFFGGLILNLMPCVFPVLGIKIMGFVNQAGQDRKKIIAHGFIFTLGVLVSFWALAGLLLFLRLALGAQIGWGFQLQEPLFVLALTLFLFLFGLNMAGLFEIGGTLVGTGTKLQGKSGVSGTFFSGVLATVVATPCSAPFLAGALGPALTLPPLQSLLLFTAIGLGLSTPYLALSAFPQLIEKLPRPGAWMETFKQGLSFLLFATAGALLWVLAAQVSERVLLYVILLLTLVAFAAWLYGRFGQGSRKKNVRRWVSFAALVLVAGSSFFVVTKQLQYASEQERIAQVQAGEIEQDFLIWQEWSPEKENALLEAGRPVYIDFTARWCATCQSNKAIAYNDEVVQAFLDKNFATLKADWTNKDPLITQRLESLGLAAVPVNAIYVPGTAEPIILPELLTPDIVLRHIEEAMER